MADLVQFLRDRLDEDEQTAREAEKRTTTTRRRVQGEWVEDTVQPPEWRRSVWSPARVLREVEAKRQIVNAHGRAALRAGGGAQHFDTATVCRSCEPDYQFPEQSWPCPTLRLLALPYADHPGYREDWRP